MAFSEELHASVAVPEGAAHPVVDRSARLRAGIEAAGLRCLDNVWHG